MQLGGLESPVSSTGGFGRVPPPDRIIVYYEPKYDYFRHLSIVVLFRYVTY